MTENPDKSYMDWIIDQYFCMLQKIRCLDNINIVNTEKANFLKPCISINLQINCMYTVWEAVSGALG